MSISTISQLAVDRTAPRIKTVIDTVDQDSFSPKQYSLELGKSDTKTNIDNAVGVLFSYIPTESIALYVAVLGALNTNDPSMDAQWIAFFLFLVFTPLVVWITYAAKIKKLLGYIPFNYQYLPLWEMVASSLAFVAWAFALPNSPFSTFEYWYSPAIAGVMILVTSTFLSLISPFFNNEK